MTITIPDEMVAETAKAMTANGLPPAFVDTGMKDEEGNPNLRAETDAEHLSRAMRTWLVNAILGQRFKAALPLTPEECHDAATRNLLSGTAS